MSASLIRQFDVAPEMGCARSTRHNDKHHFQHGHLVYPFFTRGSFEIRSTVWNRWRRLWDIIPTMMMIMAMMNVLDTIAKQQEQQQRHDEARVASYLLSNNSTLWNVVIWFGQVQIRAKNLCVRNVFVFMTKYESLCSNNNNTNWLPVFGSVGGLVPFRGGFSYDEFERHQQMENVNNTKGIKPHIRNGLQCFYAQPRMSTHALASSVLSASWNSSITLTGNHRSILRLPSFLTEGKRRRRKRPEVW